MADDIATNRYPKHVWSPAGGWYAQPKNWRANTAIMLGVVVGITAMAWSVSAEREHRYKKEKCKDLQSMACDYGVQDLWLCMAGFVEPKGIGFCQPFQGTPISATFMCRIYLVAYKFRFDFILWREPCASCASDCSVPYPHRRWPIVASPAQQAPSSVAILMINATLKSQRSPQTRGSLHSSTAKK